MSKKIYDLAVAVDTYEKDGQKKNKYQNIGAIIEKDDGGRFMLLERWFNPAGVPNPDSRSNVIVSLFEPKPYGGQQQAAQQQNSAPIATPPEPDPALPQGDDGLPF